MKALRHYYSVSIEFEYNQEHLDHMMRCSQGHYDFKCRAASELGGMLHGMQVNIDLHHDSLMRPDLRKPENTATHTFTWSELDLLCKILEQAGCHKDKVGKSTYLSCKDVFKQLRIASNRSCVLNGSSIMYPDLPSELEYTEKDSNKW